MGNSKNILNDELQPDDVPYYKDGKLICSSIPKYPIVEESATGDVLLERMRAMIRNEFSRIAEKHEMETFEEANDFDVDDGWEMDPPETKYMKEEYLNPPNPGEIEGGEGEDPDPPSNSVESSSSPKDETGAAA